MKSGAAMKVLGTTAAASPAVVTPSAIAVANHNQKVFVTRELEEAGKENRRLVQEKKDMEETRKTIQAQDAKESYEYRQQIQTLKKKTEEVELEKQSLQSRLVEQEQYNEKLRECVGLFARLLYDETFNDQKISWCAQEMPEHNLPDLRSYWQYRQVQQNQYLH